MGIDGWLGEMVCVMCWETQRWISRELWPWGATIKVFSSTQYIWGRIDKICISVGISFLFSFAFSPLLFITVVRPPQTTILPFCISFSWGGSWSLLPLQSHEPPSIVLQSLCLSDLIPWIWLSLPLYNCKGFDFGHTWLVFPIFFNFSLNLAIRSSWSEPQSAPSLVFADCIELFHLWLQRI